MKYNALLFGCSVALGIIFSVGFAKWNETPLEKRTTKTKQIVNEFSLGNAPSLSMRGVIQSLSGDVKWQSRTATIAATLRVPIKIQQGENLITGSNGNAVILFNHTRITMFPETELDFIQTLPARFVLSQPEGNAAYETSKENPVSVRSLHLLTNQPEGTMQISVDKDKSTVVIKISSGSATAAFNDLSGVSSVQAIKEGERFSFDDNTRHALKI